MKMDRRKGLIKKPKPFKDRSWKEVIWGKNNEVEVSDQINSSNDIKGDLAFYGGLLMYGIWIIPSFS